MKSWLLIILLLTSLTSFAQRSDTTYYRLATNASNNPEKLAEAVSLYTDAISISKENSGELHASYFGRGYCKFFLGDLNSAISDFEKAVHMNVLTSKIYWSADIASITKKQNALAYYLMGMAKGKLGKTQEACAALSRAGELGNEKAYEEIRKFCNH